MRRFGRIEKVTRSRNFLVSLYRKVEGDPKDFKVVTRKMEIIGVVRDVIGRVERPYALVKILVPLHLAENYIGTDTYLISKEEEKKLLRRSSNV
jgi:rRNA processing protein Gar1